MTKHKTDMNTTKRLSCFYKGALSRIQLHFREPSNKHIEIKQTSKLTKNMVSENIHSTTNKYTLFIPVTKKSEKCKTT